MEQRKVSDPGADPRLGKSTLFYTSMTSFRTQFRNAVRISVGLEDFEDLRDDIVQALQLAIKVCRILSPRK